MLIFEAEILVSIISATSEAPDMDSVPSFVERLTSPDEAAMDVDDPSRDTVCADESDKSPRRESTETPDSPEI
jgi:hypothetical protein